MVNALQPWVGGRHAYEQPLLLVCNREIGGSVITTSMESLWDNVTLHLRVLAG